MNQYEVLGAIGYDDNSVAALTNSLYTLKEWAAMGEIAWNLSPDACL
jgi:hypothetical protein